jgi:Mrp family chromosome partitioning ATPase
MVFMPNVDACLLVVAEGDNTDDDVKRSLQLIEESKYMGTILNKSEDSQSDSYYY